MPGGVRPPASAIAAWPDPNYINPETHGNGGFIALVILSPLTLITVLARVYARAVVQRKAGVDDWLMLASLVPTAGVAIGIGLAYKVYHFDRHVWDVPPADWVKERQIAWALEVLYVISSCMIKISVLLFYRRMGFRSVSRTFRVITTISIVSVILFTISFILTLSLGCQPFSAYWDRVNVGKLVQGYKYHCFDEPAFLISASFINTVQDFIATTMPAVLCWQLQVRKRQRLALYACFGVGYIVTIVSAVRIWCIWETFLLSYDASWNSYWTWICIMLETMLASIFSSIPSLRFLFQHFKESSMRISSDAGDTRHSALPGIRFWRWRQREKREHLTSEGSEIPPEVCDNMLRDGAGV